MRPADKTHFFRPMPTRDTVFRIGNCAGLLRDAFKQPVGTRSVAAEGERLKQLQFVCAFMLIPPPIFHAAR